mgnify:CR=1 FL=1
MLSESEIWTSILTEKYLQFKVILSHQYPTIYVVDCAFLKPYIYVSLTTFYNQYFKLLKYVLC